MNINKNYVNKLVSEIETGIKEVLELSRKPFDEFSIAEKYAIRYCLIVIAEVLTALAIHIARRGFGVEPETPIHALRILRDRNLLTSDECEELEKLVRLRNLLVHRYWTVDDRKIYEAIKSDFSALVSFVEKVKKVFGYG